MIGLMEVLTRAELIVQCVVGAKLFNMHRTSELQYDLCIASISVGEHTYKFTFHDIIPILFLMLFRLEVGVHVFV